MEIGSIVRLNMDQDTYNELKGRGVVLPENIDAIGCIIISHNDYTFTVVWNCPVINGPISDGKAICNRSNTSVITSAFISFIKNKDRDFKVGDDVIILAPEYDYLSSEEANKIAHITGIPGEYTYNNRLKLYCSIDNRPNEYWVTEDAIVKCSDFNIEKESNFNNDIKSTLLDKIYKALGKNV